jgi:hypothetical protein
MRTRVTLDAAGRPPDRATVLRSQGIPADATVPRRIRDLVSTTLDSYARLTEPRGMLAQVSAEQFGRVYRGEGNNAPRTPLEAIYPRADRLALFAATLGEELSREIRRLFDANEPALATMLDAVASERADHAAERLAEKYRASLVEDGETGAESTVLAYSPGYCGWHISGQIRLFDFLAPQEIGITLNPSCLMQPLKSVSGVLVVGAAEIHSFDNDFDFCDDCATQDCRARIASVTPKN